MTGVPEGSVRVAYEGGTQPKYYPRGAMDLFMQDLFSNPGALLQVLMQTYFPQKLMQQTYGGLPVSIPTPTVAPMPDRTVGPQRPMPLNPFFTGIPEEYR